MREPEWQDAPRSGWVWSLVKVLIVINLAVFLLLNVIMHYGPEPMQKFVGDFMILKAGAVKDGISKSGETVRSGSQVFGLWDGAVWQLITYQFMHFTLWHVLMNMLGLYFIGKAIEELYGRSVLLKLYLLGGVCGGLLETGFNPDFSVLSLCASWRRAFEDRYHACVNLHAYRHGFCPVLRQATPSLSPFSSTFSAAPARSPLPG